MPELPEVESVRLSLAPALLGRRVDRVRVRRRDVVEGDASAKALLGGDRVAALERLGKQLAIVGESGRVVCVQLGMSGQLVIEPAGSAPGKHAHVEWVFEGEEKEEEARAGRPRHGGLRGMRVMRFRDARRFGGVWTGASRGVLIEEKWSALGPDAVSIDARTLRGRLAGTSRSLKAALMDQGVVAGLGNIYTDESLHRAGLSPLRSADALRDAEHAALARAVRETLRAAIDRGGSSLRDGTYVDGAGRAGEYQTRHRVYGRGGQACLRCGATLATARITQRTTVWCPACQG